MNAKRPASNIRGGKASPIFCHVEFNAEVLVKIVIYPAEQIRRKIVINGCVEVQ